METTHYNFDVDVLAFGAHPDDVEFGCGGILAKMAAAGKKIAICDLTLGQKGTHGTPEVRREEGLTAAALIGAKRSYLNFADCELIDSYQGRLQLVRVIRNCKPKLVLAPMWTGECNHPDHLVCGQMVRYACRLARFASIMPEIASHRIQGVLHYPPAICEKVDFLVDISSYLPIWQAMMAAHSSQMQTFNYVDWNLRLASKWGVVADVPYAQALVKGNPIVLDDPMDVAQAIREI